MALSMKSVSTRVAARPARASLIVRASVDRRAVLGGFVATIGAALVIPKEALAIKIASQESTGGMLSGGGSVPKSSTAASMEGYTLEGYPGTKKPSFIDAGKKKSLRAKARESAMKSK